MRSILTLLAASALGIAAQGCQKQAPEATVPAVATPAKPTPKQPAQGAIGRLKEKTAVENDLRQIATWYQQEALANPQAKGLTKLDGLLQTIKQQQRAIYDAIENGDYVIVKGAHGKGIVAYEKLPDQDRLHIVAFIDGHIENIETQRLESILKQETGAQW